MVGWLFALNEKLNAVGDGDWRQKVDRCDPALLHSILECSLRNSFL